MPRDDDDGALAVAAAEKAMRFPCGFCAALLVVLALAVAVLCEKDGGSLVLAATVVPAQDKPRIGEAAQTKPAENGELMPLLTIGDALTDNPGCI